jgi:collagenase-like PrtC family protease
MQLSLGPLQYFWPRERVLAFYRSALDWPLARIHLGETVCSKRRELSTRDWIALAHELAASGREIVLSTLALLEAESELGSLRRIVENGRCLVEANDLSAVQYCRQRRLPFVAGPSLNVYNAQALSLLVEDGLVRWVPGVEQGEALIAEIRAAMHARGSALPELEVIAWGRLPLAYSARCFTARALDVGKDDCGFRCIEHPDGLPLRTREGLPFLRINGIQVQGEDIIDLAPEIAELRALGVGALRLYPQHEGMAEVVARFAAALTSALPVARAGAVNGYWRGAPGMAGLAPATP